jgi:hypothetical protein
MRVEVMTDLVVIYCHPASFGRHLEERVGLTRSHAPATEIVVKNPQI